MCQLCTSPIGSTTLIHSWIICCYIEILWWALSYTLCGWSTNGIWLRPQLPGTVLVVMDLFVGTMSNLFAYRHYVICILPRTVVWTVTDSVLLFLSGLLYLSTCAVALIASLFIKHPIIESRGGAHLINTYWLQNWLCSYGHGDFKRWAKCFSLWCLYTIHVEYAWSSCFAFNSLDSLYILMTGVYAETVAFLCVGFCTILWCLTV